MEKVFWATCPECSGRFLCDMELRHSDYELICPFCQNEFLDSESREIQE